LLQVRRKEEELLLPKEEIQQGDIVAFSMGDTVNVDAIVLKVNEGETSKDK
jgi:cation transport ATPase